MISAFGVVHKSMRLPNGARVRFRTYKGVSGGFDGPENRIEAMLRGENVGYLSLRKDPIHEGLVDMVKTKDGFKRKGIATGMWKHAKKRGLKPIHSDAQSPAGAGWAKKVGD